MLIPTQFFWTYHPEVQLDKALPEIPSPSVFNLHFLNDVQSPAAFYQDKLLQVSHVLLHAYGLGHRLNLVPRSPSHSAERTRQWWLYSCEGMLGGINTHYFLPLENNTGISLLKELLFFFSPPAIHCGMFGYQSCMYLQCRYLHFKTLPS